MTDVVPVTPKTRVVFIIDASASMGMRRHAVIEGYNRFLSTLRKRGQNDHYTVRAVSFNDRVTPVFDEWGLADAPPLTSATYTTTGLTALLDAFGSTIDAITPAPDEQILVVLQTDGEENASTTYTRSMIKEMVESRQASGHWAFVFLMADQTQWTAEETGATMGIARGNTVAYNSNATAGVFASVSGTAAAYSSGMTTDLRTTISVPSTTDDESQG